MEPIKRSFIVSIAGILSFLIYAIAHVTAIYIIKGSGYDSPTMQLIQSFILFSIIYSAAIFSRLIIKINYKIYIIIAVILILVWTVNSILFNSGLL